MKEGEAIDPVLVGVVDGLVEQGVRGRVERPLLDAGVARG